ncbi:MAG: ATP-binding cassette domain-containing protein [Candidatus Caenarcaniphilales bacterium]|nr:ATP-binding cassette domain-containing protein [Candidatus Caenarcaniphilales bacterium]
MKVPAQSYLEHLAQKKPSKLFQLAEQIKKEELLNKSTVNNSNNSEVLGKEEEKANKNLTNIKQLIIKNQENGSEESLSESNFKDHEVPNSESYNHLISLINDGSSDIKTLNREFTQWLDGIIQGQNLSELDDEKLTAEAVLHYDHLTNIGIINNLKNDIVNFEAKHKYSEQNISDKGKLSLEFNKEVSEKYNLSLEDSEKLLRNLGFKYEKEYSAEVLLNTLQDIYHEHNLEEKIPSLSQILAENIFSEVLNSSIVTSFEDRVDTDPDGKRKFNLGKVLFDSLVSNVTGVTSTHSNLEMSKLIIKMEEEIEKKNIQALFMGELAFSGDISFKEAEQILNNGKESTIELFRDILESGIPGIGRFISDTANITSMHPALGAINVATAGSQVAIAMLQNGESVNLDQQKTNIEANLATRIEGFKNVWQELLTTPNLEGSVEKILDLISDKNNAEITLQEKEVWNGFIMGLPGQAGYLVSAFVGDWLQNNIEDVDGDDVMNLIRSSMMTEHSTQKLIQKFTVNYPKHITNINRRKELLKDMGAWEGSQMEIDKQRIPLSSLNGNIDLEVADLGDKKGILRGVNLNIPKGQLVSIIGTSGAGKSTLLKTLLGINTLAEGTIKLGGENINHIRKFGRSDSLYSAVVYSTQSPNIVPGTLRENVELGTFQNYPDEQIDEVFRKLKLDKFIGKYDEPVPDFSGGEKVRFGLAKVFLRRESYNKPMIMLLDEPTASLDRKSREFVTDNLQEIQNAYREGVMKLHSSYPETTIICVTHDPDLMKLSEGENGQIIDIEEINKAGVK